MNAYAIPWDPGNSFTRDYYEQKPFALSRFGSAPWNEIDWETKLNELEQKRDWAVERDEIADVLQAFNREHGASSETLKQIERLRDPSSVVIAGGQQAGLFSGPVLVIYKAITIIQEARKASERLQRDVIPIFWVAGEDHDFDEVNHAYYLDQAQQLQKIQVEKQSSEMAPVSWTSISRDQWDNALQQLDEAWIDSEFKAGLLEKIQAYTEKSDTLTELFARIMLGLFSDYGLVLIDSQDTRLRRLEAPLFKWLIKHNSLLDHSIKQGEAIMEQEGYSLQAPSEQDQAYLFMMHEGRRTMLYRKNEGFSDRQNRFFIHESELLDELNEHPERFSNNVLSRPLMMQYVLPVLGTVLGTSEIAYWGQLKEAFEAAELTMPIVIPRYQYTIIESAVARHLRKFELSPEQVMTLSGWEKSMSEWLKSRQAVQLDDLFDHAKKQFYEMYEPIVSTINRLHPGMKKLAETNQEKIIEQMNFLNRKTNEAFLSQHEAGLRQWERIRMNLLPQDKQQERVFNVFSYVVKYGPDWLDELIQLPIQEIRSHHVLKIES